MEVIAEGDSRHVQHRIAFASLEVVGDVDVGDPGPAGRMLQRAGGIDPAVDQDEVHIIAAKRVEFGRIGAV